MSEDKAVAPGRVERALAAVERVGNKLPDPAVLFIALLFIVCFTMVGLMQVDVSMAVGATSAVSNA